MPKCSSESGRHRAGSDAQRDCPLHGVKSAQRASAPSGAYLPVDVHAMPITVVDPEQWPAPGVQPWLADRLLERRARNGFDDEEESLALLTDLMNKHQGEELQGALIEGGFASKFSARHTAQHLEEGQALAGNLQAAKAERKPSRKPQSAPCEHIRVGDRFEDGEFWTKETVVGVERSGWCIAIRTNATEDLGAPPYVFKPGDTVWATLN